MSRGYNMRRKPIIFAMNPDRKEPRICPAGCPGLDDNPGPWGCDDCRLGEIESEAQAHELELREGAKEDEN